MISQQRLLSLRFLRYGSLRECDLRFNAQEAIGRYGNRVDAMLDEKPCEFRVVARGLATDSGVAAGLF